MSFDKALDEAISVKLYFEDLNLQNKSFSEVSDILDVEEITLSYPGSSVSITTDYYDFNSEDDYSNLQFEFELNDKVDNIEYKFEVTFFDESESYYEVSFSTSNDYRVNLSFHSDSSYRLEISNHNTNEHYTNDNDEVKKHFIRLKNNTVKKFNLKKDTSLFEEKIFYKKLQK